MMLVSPWSERRRRSSPHHSDSPQNDIKKSWLFKVSQLGFMFMACGVGAFVIGIFHVMTHAFFKP